MRFDLLVSTTMLRRNIKNLDPNSPKRRLCAKSSPLAFIGENGTAPLGIHLQI